MFSRHRRPMLRIVFLLAFSFAVCSFVYASAPAQGDKQLGRITYRLAMTRPTSHLFEVSIEVETDKGFSSEFLEFQMPRWSPGR